MPMDSEMNDISLSDFTPYTIVASLEMSDELVHIRDFYF